VRRHLVTERHAHGDRLTRDRCAAVAVRVHRVEQGDRYGYAVRAILEGEHRTEVQIAGRLRDLALLADALGAALADARRIGAR
jgi:hypothetical protein